MLNGEEIENWDGTPDCIFLRADHIEVTQVNTITSDGLTSELVVRVVEDDTGDSATIQMPSAAIAAMLADALSDMVAQMEDEDEPIAVMDIEANDSDDSPVILWSADYPHKAEDITFTQGVPEEFLTGRYYSDDDIRTFILFGMLETED